MMLSLPFEPVNTITEDYTSGNQIAPPELPENMEDLFLGKEMPAIPPKK